MSTETAAHPLHEIINDLSNELAEATTDYRTTGLRLVASEHDRNQYTRMRDNHQAAITAEALNDPTLGTNDKQRAANLTLRLAADTTLATYRHNAEMAEEDCRRVERLHKNAYHTMDSLRVRLAAYTALVGATR